MQRCEDAKRRGREATARTAEAENLGSWEAEQRRTTKSLPLLSFPASQPSQLLRALARTQRHDCNKLRIFGTILLYVGSYF